MYLGAESFLLKGLNVPYIYNPAIGEHSALSHKMQEWKIWRMQYNNRREILYFWKPQNNLPNK